MSACGGFSDIDLFMEVWNMFGIDILFSVCGMNNTILASIFSLEDSKAWRNLKPLLNTVEDIRRVVGHKKEKKRT